MFLKNKRAYFDYFIEEELTVGIMLQGTEVKSIRSGSLNFAQSYCIVHAGELWLKGFHISEWKWASFSKHDLLRDRKLLLKKKELNRLSKKLINGFTIIPVNIFINDRGLIKMTIALARGKKAPDKRQTIKERDIKRSLAV